MSLPAGLGRYRKALAAELGALGTASSEAFAGLGWHDWGSTIVGGTIGAVLVLLAANDPPDGPDPAAAYGLASATHQVVTGMASDVADVRAAVVPPTPNPTADPTP